MDYNTQYEAVQFKMFEQDGQTKHRRVFLGNVQPKHTGDGFIFYIPEEIRAVGQVVIQPKKEKVDSEAIAA